MEMWSATSTAASVCALHGHSIAIVTPITGVGEEPKICLKCGLTLSEIRAGKIEEGAKDAVNT